MAAHPYISLFTGAAGLDLAVRIALPNTRAVCYVENEATAARILAARIAEESIDDAPIWSDVRTFPGELYRGRVAGVVGGFPCPDYSVAGRRKGIVGKHGQLWNAMRETIRMVDPGWVFLENVPGITNAHKINRWRCVGHDLFGRTIWSRYCIPAGIGFVLGDLAEMGFSVQWGCLPASALGASHKRDRWFALAYRPERGCRELWESSWGNGFVDGRGADVEYPKRTGERASAKPEWADPPLGIFAPGPSDPRWPDLLVRRPWLRPAISQAEAEFHLRGVADGLAHLAVRDRTDGLRATGNGVVPLQAAAMLRELIRRVEGGAR